MPDGKNVRVERYEIVVLLGCLNTRMIIELMRSLTITTVHQTEEGRWAEPDFLVREVLLIAYHTNRQENRAINKL